MKASGVIGEGSNSFPILEEFEAKKKGIRCAVYCKPLKLTGKQINVQQELLHKKLNSYIRWKNL